MSPKFSKTMLTFLRPLSVQNDPIPLIRLSVGIAVAYIIKCFLQNVLVFKGYDRTVTFL